MRIILIILSLTAFWLVGWLIINFGNNWQQNNANPNIIETKNNNLSALEIENLKSQIKIDEMSKKIDEMQKQLNQISTANIPQNTQINNTENQEKSTENEIIPVSAKFLWKILPTIELTKTENNGIFDLRTFDNTNYTTYKDEKFWMTVVASMISYENFLKNFGAIDQNIYTVNVTETFPFNSFFVNPKVSDSVARIVIKVEAQTLLISLPKSKFNTFKELILKTNS